jgi:hypothetical protein
MATTHKHSPKEIAQQVIRDTSLVKRQEAGLVTLEETIEDAIMLGIAAYTDASNQRPENLSEVCRRLGVNLHWVDGRQIELGRFEVYFGHSVPLSYHETEAETIAEIQEFVTKYPEVHTWVRAAS